MTKKETRFILFCSWMVYLRGSACSKPTVCKETAYPNRLVLLSHGSAQFYGCQACVTGSYKQQAIVTTAIDVMHLNPLVAVSFCLKTTVVSPRIPMQHQYCNASLCSCVATHFAQCINFTDAVTAAKGQSNLAFGNSVATLQRRTRLQFV